MGKQIISGEISWPLFFIYNHVQACSREYHPRLPVVKIILISVPSLCFVFINSFVFHRDRQPHRLLHPVGGIWELVVNVLKDSCRKEKIELAVAICLPTNRTYGNVVNWLRLDPQSLSQMLKDRNEDG